MLYTDRNPAPEVLATLPVFPLPNAVLLPGMVLPLNVFERRYLDLVDHVLQGSGHVGIPLLGPTRVGLNGHPAVEPVFGIGHIVSHQHLSDGRRFIRVEGLGRVRLRAELPVDTRFRKMAVDPLPEDDLADPTQLEILKAQIERIASTLEPEDEDIVHSVLGISDDRVLIYAVAAIIPTLGLLLPDEDIGTWEVFNPYLRLQQACLAADTAASRVDLLLEQLARIGMALSNTGRFPQVMQN